MTADRPQLEDWIEIADAAAATGKSVRTWRRLAKGEAETAQACGRTSLARRVLAGRGWELHRSMDKRLSVCPSRSSRNDAAREALLAKYPEHQVTAAYRRFHWMNLWRTACDTRRRDGETERGIAERIIEQAKQTEGDGFAIGWRSLQTWKSAYSKIGPDGSILGIEGLIDRRCTVAMRSSSRSPEAMEFFYSIYHAQNRLSIKLCHEATARRARSERWGWPGSYGATKKWLAAHDNRSVTFLMRRGKDAWCRRFMPYLEIDYNLIQPGELYVTDHHQLDAWVESGGKQLRPWLTAVQDLRSRAIVGWHLGESPHQDAIVAAYRQAFMDWAIPRTLRIDNGRDFTSKLLTGITKRDRDRLKKEYGGDWRRVLKRDAELVDCVDPGWLGVCNELDIETIFAIPYAPWSKGTLERWFGTFEGQCGKTFTTYCGNSALAKPECLEEIRRGYTKQEKRTLRKKYGKSWKKVAALRFVDTSDVPTMAQARETIGQYIDIYHQTPHTGINDDPVLIRIDESTVRPLPLCRAMVARFELSPNGTFDTVFRRIVTRLADTKRMLMFDEADRVCYRSLETIRDLHDATGCPVLLSGKPKIYEHLGLRNQGAFHERLDQLAGRIAIKRDLTERTRGEGGPLFSLEDVRKMIQQSGLAIKVSPDAVKWLRSRASTLGMGGIGRAMVSLYLAAKVAYAKGADSVTTDYLEDVDGLAMGQEDAGRLAEVVAASSSMKRVV